MVDIAAVAGLWGSHDQQAGRQDVMVMMTRHHLDVPSMAAMTDFNQALDQCCSRGVLVRSKGKDTTFKFSIDIQKYIMEDKSDLLTQLKL